MLLRNLTWFIGSESSKSFAKDKSEHGAYFCKVSNLLNVHYNVVSKAPAIELVGIHVLNRSMDDAENAGRWYILFAGSAGYGKVELATQLRNDPMSTTQSYSYIQ